MYDADDQFAIRTTQTDRAPVSDSLTLRAGPQIGQCKSGQVLFRRRSH